MGFGDFLGEAVSAGAKALGVDSDDIGGFFDEAKGVLGGDGDAGDLFGAAAQRLGIDTDDAGGAVDKISQLFGGGGDGGGSGGGFGGAVSDFLGGGDLGGAAQQAVGGFGALFGGGGGDIATTVSNYLPDSVKEAFADAADLPLVQDAANGNWADLAGSVPGLNSAMGSLGLSTQDVAEHIEGVANQAIDGGSAWSFGGMLADQGSQFLSQVAAPLDADHVWSSLPGVAQQAGVDLPSWTSDLNPDALLAQGGKFLQDGGFAPTQVKDAADLFATADDIRDHVADQALIKTAPAASTFDETTGESQVADPADSNLDEFAAAPTNTGVVGPQDIQADYGTDDVEPVVQQAMPEEAPAVEEAPAPEPEQFAAADELQGDLDGLGDDVFG